MGGSSAAAIGASGTATPSTVGGATGAGAGATAGAEGALGPSAGASIASAAGNVPSVIQLASGTPMNTTTTTPVIQARSAVTSRGGPPPLGSTTGNVSAPVTEQGRTAVQEGAGVFGQQSDAPAICGPAGGPGAPACGSRPFGSSPMDRLVIEFLNRQSLAPEVPGTIADTTVAPTAPEHNAPIIRTATGGFRLGPTNVSPPGQWTRVEVPRPVLGPGEQWVGSIHSHLGGPGELLAQSRDIDIPTARGFANEARSTFRSSYVVGPSGQGPYFGVIVFEPRPAPGRLLTLGVGP